MSIPIHFPLLIFIFISFSLIGRPLLFRFLSNKKNKQNEHNRKMALYWRCRRTYTALNKTMQFWYIFYYEITKISLQMTPKRCRFLVTVKDSLHHQCTVTSPMLENTVEVWSGGNFFVSFTGAEQSCNWDFAPWCLRWSSPFFLAIIWSVRAHGSTCWSPSRGITFDRWNLLESISIDSTWGSPLPCDALGFFLLSIVISRSYLPI